MQRKPWLFSFQLAVFILALFWSQSLLAQTITINIPSTPPPPSSNPSCWSWGFDASGNIALNQGPYLSQGVSITPPFVTNCPGIFALFQVPSGLPIWVAIDYQGFIELEVDPTIIQNLSSISLSGVSAGCEIENPDGTFTLAHPDLVVSP